MYICERASKFSHIHISKTAISFNILLVLQILCWYKWHLSGYIYRQISKCTEKTPKKHYGGGGGNYPLPPLATLVHAWSCPPRRRNLYFLWGKLDLARSVSFWPTMSPFLLFHRHSRTCVTFINRVHAIWLIRDFSCRGSCWAYKHPPTPPPPPPPPPNNLFLPGRTAIYKLINTLIH